MSLTRAICCLELQDLAELLQVRDRVDKNETLAVPHVLLAHSPG